MSKVLTEKILNVEEIGPAIFKMRIQSDYVAQNAKPGQFINIKCCEGLDAFLRRPISICDADSTKGTFDIVFHAKGSGTGILSNKCCGNKIDFIGPLGNQFEIDQKYKKIAVVGGGIGIFPLLFLIKKSKAIEKYSFLGFRNSELVVMEKEFEEVSKLNIATDDGSLGHKGLVTDLLRKQLEATGCDIVYACGPTPMIKGVQLLTKQFDVKCQISVEQRMGCGIGACLVCACKTKANNEEGWQYSHVCKDGPVYWSEQVLWE